MSLEAAQTGKSAIMSYIHILNIVFTLSLMPEIIQ